MVLFTYPFASSLGLRATKIIGGASKNAAENVDKTPLIVFSIFAVLLIFAVKSYLVMMSYNRISPILGRSEPKKKLTMYDAFMMIIFTIGLFG